MTIENEDRFRQSLWDWGPLDECFPRKIKMADVDGEVEIGGRFLRIEGKSPSAPIKRGTQLHFQALVKTGLWTIIVLRGYPKLRHNGAQGLITSWSVWPHGASGSDWSSLKDFVQTWASWAVGKEMTS